MDHRCSSQPSGNPLDTSFPTAKPPKSDIIRTHTGTEQRQNHLIQYLTRAARLSTTPTLPDGGPHVFTPSLSMKSLSIRERIEPKWPADLHLSSAPTFG